MAFFGLLAYFVLRSGGPLGRRVLAVALALLAIGLIGVSRVYLGEHYPTDVLGGWTVGLTWLASTVTAVETWRRRRELLLEQDAGSAAGYDSLSG
jgi:undecaprenyl-diphosphatase